jgi:hypothetical protein
MLIFRRLYLKGIVTKKQIGPNDLTSLSISYYKDSKERCIKTI